MTTINILFSVLHRKLRSIRILDVREQESFEDILRRNANIRFKTIDCDNSLFQDYMMDFFDKEKNEAITESAKRIVKAFGFFELQMEDKEEEYITIMLNAIQKASCTIQIVKNESEAIQIFDFQKRRDKIN